MSKHQKLRPVAIKDVRITGGFFLPRIQTNRNVTLPYQLKQFEESGIADYFEMCYNNLRLKSAA